MAGTETAEVVDRGRVGGNVDDPALVVGRHRGPRGHVPRVLPGIVLPRLVPVLAGARDDVELPPEFAGARVETENVARHVLDARLVVSLLGRIPYHDRPVHHDRRRRGRDVAECARDAVLRVVIRLETLPRGPAGNERHQHVHHARLREAVDGDGLAEAVDVPPRFGVERVQEEGGRRVVDDPSRVDFPVCDALPVVLPHGAFPARGVGFAVGPQGLAGLGVDGRHGAPLPRHRVQDPVNVGGGRLHLLVDVGAKVVGVPHPGDLEVAEVVRVDLVDGRVAGAPCVGALEAPLTVGVLALLGGGG